VNEVRRLLLDKSKQLKITLRGMSEAVGMNETFVHQFIKKGTPKYLTEECRRQAARADPDNSQGTG
jgi:hypothetical protein